MSIKLVAIDIDGTLLNSHNLVSEKTKSAIQKAKQLGVTVVLTTGRPFLGVKKFLEELSLLDDQDYVITYNGSLVQRSKSEEVLVSYGLTYDNFIEIEAMARKVGVHLHTTDYHHIYTANQEISPYTIHEAYLTGMPLRYRAVDQMTDELAIIKMMMIDEPAVLDAGIAKLPQAFLDKYSTAKSADFFFEVLNPEADKGHAVSKLAEHLGLDVSEVMTIGDNENDLSMITYAGTGVAMGNAVESVKQVADKMTLTNDQDGVAYALEQWVFPATEA